MLVLEAWGGENMNIKKKLVSLSVCLLAVLGTLSTVSAYVYVSGTGYQTVTFVDIPGGGYGKSDTYYGSKKATTGKFATFVKVRGDAALGNFGEIITSSENQKSELVGLRTTPSLAQEFGCSKGTVYFSAVTSHTVEPSNKCDVTMKFSADNLKQ